MRWTLKRFDELTLDEFHDIVQLRINIFVVEQNCPYPELDDKDRLRVSLFLELTDTGTNSSVYKNIRTGVQL